MAELFVNDVVTSLAAGVTSSATTLTLASAASLPVMGAGDTMRARLSSGSNFELVTVTARSGTSLTVLRGQEGTAAAAWSTGAEVDFVFTAATLTGLGSAVQPALLSMVAPSGDATGATDAAAINAAFTSFGRVVLQAGATYTVNAQLVSPDTGGIEALAGPRAIIRQAAGTNLAVPMVTTKNFASPSGGTPSAASLPVVFRNLVIDVNAQNQSYAGQSWLTAGPNYLNGPDGLTVNNTDAEIDVVVINPVRHGIVTCDASAGTNTVGTYTGVGAVTPSNVYGMKLRYTVTGWGLVTGNYQNNCTGTMTAGSTSVTGVSGTGQPGMTVFGPGVFPNTILVSVSGTTWTLSQKVGYGSTGTFYTTWGQRGRWNTGVGNGCTDGWELPGCQTRQMNGDWSAKFDTTGGWRSNAAQHWGCAYSGAQYLFAQNAVIQGNSPSDLGASPVGVATVNGAISSGAFVAPLAVNAIPVALPQFTPLIVRTASGPLFLMTNSAVAAGATSLPVYGATAPGAISNGATVYLPVVGKMTGSAAGGPPVDVGNIVYTKENAATDYVYQCWISADTSARSRSMGIGNNTSQNYGSTSGASSIAFGFASPGTNTAYFYGTSTLVSEGQTPITTTFASCGGSTIVLDNTPATAASVTAEATARAAADTAVVANTQTASYTLALADAGKVIEMNVGSAHTLTVPPNSSVAFPVGTIIEVCQYGAGQTTITAGAGVTIDNPSSLTTRTQYSTVALRKRATNEWVLSGDVT